MRTSRTARDAAKLAAILPRRTRSSQLSADIEDAAGASAPPANRKRKLSTGTNTTAASKPPARTSKRAARSPKAEDDPGSTTAVKAEDGEEVATATATAPQPAPRKPRAKPARRAQSASGSAAAVTPPENWEAQYAACASMRARISAPVDTMGCERLADPAAAPADQRFQTLVSLMLSSQTKDAVTAEAVRRLQTELPGPGLTAAGLAAADAAAVNALIGKVGFHNTKTATIQAAARHCAETLAGDVPRTAEGLMALQGVGPKMAHLCMAAAWGEATGIGVDVHVHRITNLWGWHATKGPEQTRLALEAWLPREKWHDINTQLVGLGQTVCAPVGRRCGDCDLGLQGLCPGAVGSEVRKGVQARRAKAEAAVKQEDHVHVEIDENEGPAV